ncbi:LysR family transcriptional regulator [Nocardioides mesophilus]|uniref:LysR family transcriptional regulator n=1 Tax=Nocardioides mesophilus TaxID=433659 RepID=A0A7G9R884_9ACTN|nr:LysR family transcriptional regulator [Nocardioides mesophilus]QNN51809.1 LysR family transcriptional regulator [Nocardioides mesophilus]
MAAPLNLEDLRVLVLVAEQGSIGRAAAQLGFSQPTVSRRMSALERSLRLPLLERSSTGSSLTPTGQVVVDWATKLLESADDFSRSLEVLRGAHRPSVRAAVSMTIAEHHAPQWVGRLRQHHPNITVTLLVQKSARVAELVTSGEVDVGFVESVTLPPALERHRIAWDRLVVAVHPDHPWAEPGRVVSAAEVGQAPLMVREPGSGTRETLEQALKRRGHPLNPGLEMASNTALKSAALAGMGPVVLSTTALAAELASGKLVAVRVARLGLRRPLTAIWRQRPQLSDAALALVETATTAPA